MRASNLRVMLRSSCFCVLVIKSIIGHQGVTVKRSWKRLLSRFDRDGTRFPEASTASLTSSLSFLCVMTKPDQELRLKYVGPNPRIGQVKIAALLLRIPFRLTIWDRSTVSPVDRRRRTANIYVRQRGSEEFEFFTKSIKGRAFADLDQLGLRTVLPSYGTVKRCVSFRCAGRHSGRRVFLSALRPGSIRSRESPLEPRQERRRSNSEGAMASLASAGPR